MKKNWTIFLILATMLMGCATTAEKREREARTAAQVTEALANRHYSIRVLMMYPRRSGAVNVTSDYSLEVKGDTLVSYLPYFGRAYNVPYGGGKGLNFTAPVTSYESARMKKNQTYIVLTTDNGEGPLRYELEIFDNGNSFIRVFSRERETIEYSGEMEVF